MLWCLSLWMGVGWYCGWDFWMSSVEFSIHQLWSACRRGLSVGFSRKVRWDCCFACAVVCMLFAVVITTHLKFIVHDIRDCGWGEKIIFQSIAIFYLKMWTNILTNIKLFRYTLPFKRLGLSPRLHLFDQKSSRNSNIVKYYFNLK